ncbi:LOW QUALITY PROTEIN: hypothetical protein HID58_020559, partial [Brassica napus]
RKWKLSAPSSTTNTPPSRDFDFRKLSKLSFRFVSPEIFKFSELDEVNRKQEDESSLPLFQPQTQHLRSENQNLKENMERLRNEIAEIRHIYQGRGAFGVSKTLSEQVEKIKELISEGVPHYNKNQSGRTRKTPESPQVTTMRKRSRQTEDMVEMDTTEDIMETDVVSPHISETLLVSQPQCCKTTDSGSSNSAGCPFQALGEHLTGVKLSTNNKDKRICIVASHPSSGTSCCCTRLSRWEYLKELCPNG